MIVVLADPGGVAVAPALDVDSRREDGVQTTNICLEQLESALCCDRKASNQLKISISNFKSLIECWHPSEAEFARSFQTSVPLIKTSPGLMSSRDEPFQQHASKCQPFFQARGTGSDGLKITRSAANGHFGSHYS